jgi:hypothetical protein
VPRALANFDTLGAVKLVTDATTGRLLGVHAAAAEHTLLATPLAPASVGPVKVREPGAPRAAVGDPTGWAVDRVWLVGEPAVGPGLSLRE